MRWRQRRRRRHSRRYGVRRRPSPRRAGTVGETARAQRADDRGEDRDKCRPQHGEGDHVAARVVGHAPKGVPARQGLDRVGTAEHRLVCLFLDLCFFRCFFFFSIPFFCFCRFSSSLAEGEAAGGPRSTGGRGRERKKYRQRPTEKKKERPSRAHNIV